MPLRFRTRHIQQTLVEYLRTELTTLGWFGPDVPFDTDPIELREVEFSSVKEISGNVVAVTIPDESDDLEHEVGGGVYRCGYPLFVDIHGLKPSIAVSIGGDVKDVLRDIVIPVKDFGQDPPVDSADTSVEVERVRMERPPSSYGATDFKRNWRVVVAEMTAYFGVT